ncbi:hypothetical protein KCV06_g193, partial [Aureobasidium melanogenum]
MPVPPVVFVFAAWPNPPVEAPPNGVEEAAGVPPNPPNAGLASEPLFCCWPKVPKVLDVDVPNGELVALVVAAGVPPNNPEEAGLFWPKRPPPDPKVPVAGVLACAPNMPPVVLLAWGAPKVEAGAA